MDGGIPNCRHAPYLQKQNRSLNARGDRQCAQHEHNRRLAAASCRGMPQRRRAPPRNHSRSLTTAIGLSPSTEASCAKPSASCHAAGPPACCIFVRAEPQPRWRPARTAGGTPAPRATLAGTARPACKASSCWTRAMSASRRWGRAHSVRRLRPWLRPPPLHLRQVPLALLYTLFPAPPHACASAPQAAWYTRGTWRRGCLWPSSC